MKLPPTTNKQRVILNLLYKHRFLNRIQIQALMGHKDYKTINVWLKDLRANHYVERIYSTDFAEKTKPAIYYLGLNGIRLLSASADYPAEELRKRYREPSRSRGFVDQWVVVADCCLNLASLSTANQHYSYVIAAEYADPASEYNFLVEDESVHPQLGIVRQTTTRGNVVTSNFLLEVIDATLPHYRLRKRLKDYLGFLEDGDWDDLTGSDEPPLVLLVCPTLSELIYAKRCTKRLLEDAWEDEDIHIRFTSSQALAKHGVMSAIWEKF